MKDFERAKALEDGSLTPESATTYRAMSARGNYLSQDRSDIQFAVKQLSKDMSSPNEGNYQALKRLGRYLSGKKRLVYQYPWQTAVEGLDIYADTDHAGCLRTRKSTSGGCAMLGAHMLKSWSSTQPTITLSSGEAELQGVIKGAAAGLGHSVRSSGTSAARGNRRHVALRSHRLDSLPRRN